MFNLPVSKYIHTLIMSLFMLVQTYIVHGSVSKVDNGNFTVCVKSTDALPHASISLTLVIT